MTISVREAWTVLHGMLFGAAFLLAFAGGLAGLYSLRPEWVTGEGVKERIFRLKVGLWSIAVIAWATVISGTFIVYPWYRAKPPEGATDLTEYPRYLLLADPSKAEWHKLGMEWKEHVGWLAPIAATVVAFAVTYYGSALAKKVGERRTLMIFYIISFATAAVAGVFGAFINKIAPIR
ncbi:MAG: hypothetical protein M1369_04290 [Deinococcus sp.]|nr:hypothetical protein [Deinococcus sp.]MCL5964988.1 hypothetical protein [Deinococcus sp.]